MTEAPAKRERLPGLDILRGLAAVVVVAFHFTTRFGVIFGHPVPLGFGVPWGQHGVEVFFVISGFAIALSLEPGLRESGPSESGPSAREFLSARVLRLYPTFLAALAVTLTVTGACGLPERVVSVHDALVNLTMVPVSLGAQAADAVYWTLERELRFYGLVLLLLSLGLGRYLVHAVLVTVAVQTMGVAGMRVPHWVSDLSNVGFAHLFACGVLIARFRRAPLWKALLAVLPCVLASRAVGSLALTCTVASVALVWAATRPMSPVRLRPLVFLGKSSYPLYLVHQYVGYVVMRALYARGASPSLAIGAAIAVGLAAATSLHVLVERPSLELIRRNRNATRAPAPSALARAL